MLVLQDVTSLNTFFQSNFATTPEEKQLSVSGKNWGEVDLNGTCIFYQSGRPSITFKHTLLSQKAVCLLSYAYACVYVLVAFETTSGLNFPSSFCDCDMAVGIKFETTEGCYYPPVFVKILV